MWEQDDYFQERYDGKFSKPSALANLLGTGLLRQVFDYWNELRCERAFPARADFNPMHIPKALPTTFLVDALPDKSFRFRLAGTFMEEFYGVGKFAGKSPVEMFGPRRGGELDQLYAHIRDTGLAFYRLADLDWVHDDKKYGAFSVVVLPFSEDGKTINMLLGVHVFERET